MNSKILLLALLLLVCSILVPPGLFIRAKNQENIRSSSQASVLFLTDIGGTQTVIISDGYYVMNETLTVKENATLLVQNAELMFNISSSTILYVYDFANVTIVNSNISRFSGSIYLYAYDASSITVTNSLLCVNSYVYAYDFSKIHCVSSRVYDLTADDHSTVTIENTQMSYVSLEEHGSVLLQDSTVLEDMELNLESDTTITVHFPANYTEYWDITANNTVVNCYLGLTLIRTQVKDWNVYCHDTSRITFQDSVLDTCSIQENSTAFFVRCQVRQVSVYYAANVVMEDSSVSEKTYLEIYYGSKATLSVQPGHYSSWNLYSNNLIENAIINLTLQNCNLTKWAFSIYNSSIVIGNSTIDYIYLYEDSTVELLNSTCNGIYNYAASQLEMEKSTVNYLYSYDTAHAFVEECALRTVSSNSNATTTVVESDVEYIEVNQYASMLVIDSNILYSVQLSLVLDSSVTLSSLPIGLTGYWNLYQNSSVSVAYLNLTIINSKVRGWSTIYTYEDSNLVLLNCVLGSLYAYDQSTVAIVDSFVDYIAAYDRSNITMQNSVTNEFAMYFEDDSKTTLSYLSPGMIDFWNIFENETAERIYTNYTVSHSRIGSWSATLYDNSEIAVTKSVLQTFSCQGHSIGSLENCTVYYTRAYDYAVVTARSTSTRYLYAYDESTSSITDSEVTTRIYIELIGDTKISVVSVPVNQISHWSLMSDATVIRAYVSLAISNSKVKSWTWYIYGTSFFAMSNSAAETVTAYECSTVILRNCTIETVNSYKFSKMTIEDYSSAKSTLGYAYTYDSSTMTFMKSAVGSLYAYSDSYVRLIGTMHSIVRVYDRARVQVEWFLRVRVIDRNNQNVSLAAVNYRDPSGTKTGSTLTDLEGIAAFILIEKTINATGTYHVGAYTINATYSGHSDSRSIEMPENREILIQLDFVIPEFPTLVLIGILIAATVAAFGVYSFRHRKHSTNIPPPPPPPSIT